MSKDINMDAVVDLAISTAILRADFDNQTSPSEIEEQNAWDDIAKQAIEYLKVVGLDTTLLKMDKYMIAKSFWDMEKDELDDELNED